MNSNLPNGLRVLNASVREAFGRVVYSHKTHEKAREIESRRAAAIKWINIVLTSLTSGGLLATILSSVHVWLYVTSVLSALNLAFVIFQLSFDPAGSALQHRITAKELWYVREKYANLLTDIQRGLSEDAIVVRRDALAKELNDIYAKAPNTSGRAYQLARQALKIQEDMTFNAREINQFLPKELHLDE